MREILLLAHRQAFAWIDEWYGMTIDEVREYENKMQVRFLSLGKNLTYIVEMGPDRTRAYF